MDVLRPAASGVRWPCVALFIWLLVTACLSFPSAKRTEPSFPHRVHVVDNQLACGFCHGGAIAAQRPGMPPPELCAPCHDDLDVDKPPERRIAAFYGDGGRYLTVAASGLPADVSFSHRRHVTDAKLDCVACHADVASQDDVPIAAIAHKPDCMDCHRSHGMSNACSECHSDINETWQPPSHARDWLRSHGDVVLSGSDRSADTCSLCHQDATGCLACHQQMAPDDHDQTFRLRTHGLRASMDRSRCQVCHTQDSCQQCHLATRPRSHRGGFGSPRQRHCVTCHLPVQESSCSICHPSAASHEQGTELPADHLPSMNCRQCHGNGVALLHPDGGHACTACHR